MTAIPLLAPVVIATRQMEGFDAVGRLLEKSGVRNPLKLFRTDDELLGYLLSLFAPTFRYVIVRPCLVLVELELPRHGAFAPLRWIRQQTSLEDVPAMILADSFNATDVCLAAALDVSRFVNKNLSAGALAELILGRCRDEMTPPTSHTGIDPTPAASGGIDLRESRPAPGAAPSARPRES